MHWFSKAAAQGHVEAKYNLGVCFADGEGESKDLREAKRLIKLPADQGNTAALSSCKLLRKPRRLLPQKQMTKPSRLPREMHSKCPTSTAATVLCTDLYDDVRKKGKMKVRARCN